MRGRVAFAAVVFAIAAGLAYGQQAVTVVGPITPGDCAAFNSTTVLKDAGVNCASGGGGTGTVTSVALSLPNLVFNISGSPVTNNGTLTGSFANQNGNTALMGAFNGASGPPAFRAISSADLPLPTATTVGAIFAGGPVTSSYVFAQTTTGGTLLRQPQFAELAGTAAPSQLPVATNTAYGVTETVSQIPSNWVNSWINGIPQLSQPGFPDIAGTIATSQLPSAGNNTVLSNISGGTAPPVSNSLSAVIDSAFGSVQGDILYRGGSVWLALPPGISGQVLTTSGANNNPLWSTISGTGTMTQIFAGAQIQFSTTPCTTSCVVAVASSANNTILANTAGSTVPPVPTSPSTVLDIFGSAQGDLVYRGSSIWQALAPGTAGQFLQTQGAGATPLWATVTAAQLPGTNTNNNANAGNLGEYKSSIIVSGSGTGLTNGSPTNLATLSLTAGDWDVWAECWFAPTGTNTAEACGVNTSSGAFPTQPADSTAYAVVPGFPGGTTVVVATTPTRASLGTTTTYNMVVQCNYSSGSCTGYGKLVARRVR